ncbi:carbamoyltransferase HypF [Lutimonas sp.]|uniref:carbamoyltransferase HypF n=1 Tax=Lutimonas sp. TaxID=1872403 RepID=UPI003D9B4D99
MLVTCKIAISGRVQGVGFRPFVSNLANRMDLSGYVSNNKDGVIIMVSGKADTICHFYKDLIEHPPPLARIRSHRCQDEMYVAYESFTIVPSPSGSKLNLALTPDFGICPECRQELMNPDNRRYQYAFTTCVNCGPRWAITNTFPFERDHTTLNSFKMCSKCEGEYGDPSNRRFHSQTNSCPECGIQLTLSDSKGHLISDQQDFIFKDVNELLKKGNIIGIKNTGGYLICCDATNRKAIKRLRRLKRRPKKPFAILYPSLDMLEKELDLESCQKNELCAVERPIVIVSGESYKGKMVLEEIAPGLKQLGIMLPYSGVLELLSNELETPVIATSGNMHGSPIIKNRQEATEAIGEIVDFFVHHNLSISNPQDDSVIKFSKHQQRIVFRRSRGYAPNYLEYSKRFDQKILALGAHLKSTIAFAPNDYLYLSEYLGNLDHYQVYERFKLTTSYFQSLFDVEPDVIIVDKHPGYVSSQFGKEFAEKIHVPIYKVQHHKAHFAAVLGEHDLFNMEDGVLGVVWDGTGFGDDGHIWGGEFFTYKDRSMVRSGHFEYFHWMAGDKMAKEPRISLYALNEDNQAGFLKEKFSREEQHVYQSLKKINRLKTSSVGRIFDALASLLGVCDANSYEGEAAILLENSIVGKELTKRKAYTRVGKDKILSTKILWEGICRDFESGANREVIILNFFYTLALSVVDMADLLSVKNIALSGGVFQNTVLIDMVQELCGNDYKLFMNKHLSPNDENISYGQLMYYTHCRENKGTMKSDGRNVSSKSKKLNEIPQ